MITNTLGGHSCTLAYLSAILEHLRNIPNYHFITAPWDKTPGTIVLPDWGKHVVPLIDPSEGPENPLSFRNLDNVHRVWVSLITAESDQVRAMPLGPVGDIPVLPYKPPAERTLDVFFCGRSLPAREGIPHWRDLLRKAGLKVQILTTAGWRHGLSVREYAENLMDAKIALCPNGLVPETFRLYEAVRSGCAVISHTLPQTRLFQDSPIQQLVSWDDDELVQTICDLLANIDVESANSLQLWKDRYAPEAVANYIRNNL